MIKFKLYKESELVWPQESYLIINQKNILPKHGGSKRISAEQDYESDKDVIHSAKNKNKRELKTAIEEFVGEKMPK